MNDKPKNYNVTDSALDHLNRIRDYDLIGLAHDDAEAALVRINQAREHLSWIKALHASDYGADPLCTHCNWPWPCDDSIRVVAALAALGQDTPERSADYLAAQRDLSKGSDHPDAVIARPAGQDTP